jgi:hypothetical protein
MQLRFGRFLRPTRRAARRVVDVPYESPVAQRPPLTKDARDAWIVELANQVDEHGQYVYSSNKIKKIVGGQSARIGETIATVRGKKEQPPPARHCAAL